MLKERAGELILGEKPEYGMAFQLFIQPFDEPGPLTVERIKRDLPEIVIDTPIKGELSSTGTRIIRFTTVDDTLGAYPGAWFVHDGYLYQIAMYAPYDGGEEGFVFPWFRNFLQDLTFTE